MSEQRKRHKKTNSNSNDGINVTNTTDRISHLPDDVMHHILSFLSTKDVVRIRVLSKMWQRIWTSFPIWDFQESLVGLPHRCWMNAMTYEEEVYKREKFLAFVHESLLRQCHHSSGVQRFRISITPQRKYASFVEQLIELVLRSSVKELDIGMDFENYSDAFIMPETIFSATTLKALRLRNCDFKLPLHCARLIWPALQELSLHRVNVSEEFIEKLISYCPSIEKLVLVQCKGLGKLELSGFTRLNEVVVDEIMGNKIRKISIDLLSLRIFRYLGEISESHLDVTSCKNLEVLKLSSDLTDGFCQNLISKLPCLKSLCLSGSSLKVKIASGRLENLELSSPKEAIIDAPNLLSFKYFAWGSFPSVFLMSERSRLREVSCRLLPFELGASYLIKAREFLAYFNQIKLVDMAFPIKKYSSYNFPEHLEDFPIIPALPDVKQLKLMIIQRDLETEAAAITNKNTVDVLFWMCRPGCLLLESGLFLNNKFMEFLCTTLMTTNEGGGHDCCDESSQIKCWRHDYRGYHIEQITGNGDVKTLTGGAFLELLPALAPRQTIRFVFKW